MRCFTDPQDKLCQFRQVRALEQAANRRNAHRSTIRNGLYRMRSRIFTRLNRMECSLRAWPQDVLRECICINCPLNQVLSNDLLVRHKIILHKRIQDDKRLCRIICELSLCHVNSSWILRWAILERRNLSENLPNPPSAQQLRRHAHRIAKGHAVERT